MLDLYKRECPRCHGAIHDEPVRCPACHKLLPARLSKTRRIVEGALLGVLMTTLLAAFFVPDLVRSLRTPEEQHAAVAPWRGSGAEPPARAWAVRIERNLENVCASTAARYADRKFVTAALTQQLGAVTAAQGLRITQEALRLTADEEREAMGLVGDEKRFVRECLRWAYNAVEPCKVFKEDLGGREAEECMVPRVLRVLAVAPFSTCAQQATTLRVRRACELASEAAAHNAEKR